MKIICSWCLREGKVELIGEKSPLKDPRETHGICKAHYRQFLARWRKRLRASAGTGSDHKTAANLGFKRRTS